VTSGAATTSASPTKNRIRFVIMFPLSLLCPDRFDAFLVIVFDAVDAPTDHVGTHRRGFMGSENALYLDRRRRQRPNWPQGLYCF
jgi:hypothetical protein